jgi:hypothetical protein
VADVPSGPSLDSTPHYAKIESTTAEIRKNYYCPNDGHCYTFNGRSDANRYAFLISRRRDKKSHTDIKAKI